MPYQIQDPSTPLLRSSNKISHVATFLYIYLYLISLFWIYQLKLANVWCICKKMAVSTIKLWHSWGYTTLIQHLLRLKEGSPAEKRQWHFSFLNVCLWKLFNKKLSTLEHSYCAVHKGINCIFPKSTTWLFWG